MRDLAAGSGIEFDDPGVQFKGIPSEWRLCAARLSECLAAPIKRANHKCSPPRSYASRLVDQKTGRTGWAFVQLGTRLVYVEWRARTHSAGGSRSTARPAAARLLPPHAVRRLALDPRPQISLYSVPGPRQWFDPGPAPLHGTPAADSLPRARRQSGPLTAPQPGGRGRAEPCARRSGSRPPGCGSPCR